MRRLLTIAIASLAGAALAVPTAQATTRTRYFQDVGHPGDARIRLKVIYKDKHDNGQFKPRSVVYDAAVRVFCNPEFSGATVPSSSTTRITLRNGSFSYSYSHPVPGTTPQNTGRATGKIVNTPKPQVDGTVEIFNYTTLPGFLNCTSDGPMPYWATPCRPLHNRPPYIKPSLPGCVPEV